ncbi:hypothetical protein Esti_005317 [Eimeria stiedai]
MQDATTSPATRLHLRKPASKTKDGTCLSLQCTKLCSILHSQCNLKSMVCGVPNGPSICAVITCLLLTLVKAQDSPSRQGAALPSSLKDPSGFQNAFSPPQPAYSNTGWNSESPKNPMGRWGENDPAPQANDTNARPDAPPSNDFDPPSGDVAPQQSQGIPPQPGEGRMSMGARAAGAGLTQPGATDATSARAGAVGAAAESELQKLTEFRPRHRKTVDGRLCAAAFVHEGQTFTDCTDARSPDGVTGREWCYVEVQLLGKGPKDWEFCTPPLNYNALRAFAKKEFGALMATNEEMIESLDVEERRLQDMQFRCVRCHPMQRALSQWCQRFPSFQHTCGAAHAALKESLGQTESRLSRGINYEADPVPDGLRAAYFANDRFTWPPAKYRTDRKIDFLFFADGPIEGVPSHAYSIRKLYPRTKRLKKALAVPEFHGRSSGWDGFILAPHSGTYVFTTETDCGVRVFLNTRPIIVDRMPAATEADAFGYKSVHLVATEERSGVHRKDSPKTELISGEKYRIRIELAHSNHLKYKSPDTGVFRLDSKVFDSAFLRDGVQPFVDDKSHYLVDIPLRYYGRRMLRSLSQPNIDSFAVELNEEVLSLVGGPVLAECEASSEKPGGYDCNSGLNGKHMDRKFGTWKTKGAGVGQSITVRFRHSVQLTHFRFKPLDDQLLWPSQITLSYSAEEGDEEAETFSMRHSNSLEHNTYKLRAPLITQYSECSLLVTVSGGKTTFKRDTANDIGALDHGPSDASYTLAKAPCEPLEDEKPSLYFTFGSESAPEGWLVDDGSMRRMRNGNEYGWLRPSVVSSLANLKDPITEAGVVFPSPSNHTCQLGEDCTPNFWSVVVAHNGVYQVEVLLAVPFESQYASAPTYLHVNGVSIAHGAVVPKGRVFGGAATVEVTEKLIDVASVCKDAACGVEPTMLLSLSISYIGPLPGHNYEKEDE